MANSGNSQVNNQSIPVETRIYFSKTEEIGGVIAGFIAIGTGVWFFTMADYFWSIAICLAGLFLVQTNLKTFKNSKPQIIINHSGIVTAFAPFHSWYQITNERVVIESQGRYAAKYLIYNTNNGVEKISISDLNISMEALQNLLYVYRKRSNIKTK